MAEKTINESENQLKLVFLEVLLEKRADIKHQYQEFMLSKSKEKSTLKRVKDIEQLIEEVKELTKEYTNELETLDLENFDWEDYIPRHSGYIPEYEATEHMAEDLVEGVMNSWESILFDYLDSGDSTSAVIHLIAQYNACLLAEIDDPHENLGDPSDYIKGELKSIFEKLVPKFKKIIFSENQVEMILKICFTEVNILNEHVSLFLNFFEPLLLVMIDTRFKAKICGDLMNSYNISSESVPQIALQNNKLLGDEQSWIENAESLCTIDKEVAKQLMNYYLNSSESDFLRISKKVFPIFKDAFIDYLLEHVNEKLDTLFYKELLLYKVESQNHFPSFKKLRPLLNSNETDTLIDSFFYGSEIKIQILEYEKRYKDIYKIIVERKNSAWHLPMLIKPILNIYPKECFSILERRCIRSLERERGRNIYKSIVTWIQLAKTIVGYEKKTDSLIRKLYNWTPRLPALRDEFNRGGLV